MSDIYINHFLISFMKTLFKILFVTLILAIPFQSFSQDINSKQRATTGEQCKAHYVAQHLAAAGYNPIGDIGGVTLYSYQVHGTHIGLKCKLGEVTCGRVYVEIDLTQISHVSNEADGTVCFISYFDTPLFCISPE